MKRYVYIGTYNHLEPGIPVKTSYPESIHLFRMDPYGGELQFLRAMQCGPNPSYMTIHPNRKYLYTVNELSKGSVSAFCINTDGSLNHLNSRPTRGIHPCYISLSPDGRHALVANYSSGSLSIFPILPDGGLESMSDHVQHTGKGPNRQRQENAHAHSILFDPSGKFVLAADLGKDEVLVYRMNANTEKLTAHDPAGIMFTPGAGPRHIAFHPNGKMVYIACELDSSVTACTWDSGSGSLTVMQTLSTLPIDYKADNQVADIHFHPDGKWLYISNRGHDSLAIFAVDNQGGLTATGHVATQGRLPRNFTIDPEGRFLLVANQFSHNLVTFKLEDGLPLPSGEEYDIPSPVFAVIVDICSIL
jgi:6-phosphogluconolactonase